MVLQTLLYSILHFFLNWKVKLENLPFCSINEMFYFTIETDIEIKGIAIHSSTLTSGDIKVDDPANRLDSHTSKFASANSKLARDSSNLAI